MTEKNLNYYDQEFESNSTSFKREVLSQKCPNVNSGILSQNYNNAIEEMQIKINELKVRSIDFTKSFSPVLQMKNCSLINHRLQIATKIREICYLYKSFDYLYCKNESDPTILDLLKLIQLYSKLNKILPQYVQIQTCCEIKEKIDQKILKLRDMIVQAIRNRGYYKLTSSELFQLIIITSSFQDFWSLFGLTDSLFETKNLDFTEKYLMLSENIEKVSLFFSKIEKLSNLLIQLELKAYLVGVQKAKEHFKSLIINNLIEMRPKVRKIVDFENFSDSIFEQLRILKTNEIKETISTDFKNILKSELSKTALYVYDTFVTMEPEQFRRLTSNNNEIIFLNFLEGLNTNLKLFIIPEDYELLSIGNKVDKFILLLNKFAELKFKQGFATFPSILDEVIFLTNAAKTNNEEFIQKFKLPFYNVALFELNSVIDFLLKILKMNEDKKKFDANKAFKKKFNFILYKVDNKIDFKKTMIIIIHKLLEIITIKNTQSLFFHAQCQYINSIKNTFEKKYGAID